MAAYRAGEYAQAVIALAQAVKQAPRDAECQWSLGGALMAQWIPGVPTEENAAVVSRAEAAFKAALELEPWTRTALASLESLEFQQGRVAIGAEARAAHFDQAESWYRKIRELYPEDKSGFYPLGVIAWERRRIDEAVMNLRRALVLDPYYDATVQYLDASLRAKQTTAAFSSVGTPGIHWAMSAPPRDHWHSASRGACFTACARAITACAYSPAR